MPCPQWEDVIWKQLLVTSCGDIHIFSFVTALCWFFFLKSVYNTFLFCCSFCCECTCKCDAVSQLLLQDWVKELFLLCEGQNDWHTIMFQSDIRHVHQHARHTYRTCCTKSRHRLYVRYVLTFSVVLVFGVQIIQCHRSQTLYLCTSTLQITRQTQLNWNRSEKPLPLSEYH